MNFLPQNMQRAFARDRVLRLLATCGFGFFIFACVALALLVPAYFAVQSEKLDTEQTIANLKSKSSAAELETSLAGHSSILRSYIPSSGIAGYKPLDLLKKLLALRSQTSDQGVTINSWAFARAGNEGTFQLVGIGATRDALLTFRTAVRTLPFVKDANYSQQILTIKNDAPFTLTLTLK